MENERNIIGTKSNMDEVTSLRTFSLVYLQPIAKELSFALDGKAREEFNEKIAKYYVSDPRSLSGLCIANIRVLVNERRLAVENLAKARSRLEAIQHLQGDLFHWK